MAYFRYFPKIAYDIRGVENQERYDLITNLLARVLVKCHGWKDSDGDEIIPEELFDGEFDAGHIVAHDNAGQTTPDNMVIEKMKQNRGKGKETTQVV